MPGTRRFKDPDEEAVNLTVRLTPELERKVRALAARRGIGVSPLLRAWIERELWADEQWTGHARETNRLA
jgi:hypothetical protein